MTPVYILTKDGVPYCAGTKKYHIRHVLEKLSDKDKSGMKFWYAANSTNFMFVERNLSEASDSR